MPRTAKTAITDLLGDHYDSGIKIQPFIDTAAVLVDWLDGVDSNNELNSGELELIERYLGCHFYAHADQIAQSKMTGRAEAEFMGKTGMVLSATQYGQTAMLLDSTGNLAKRSQEVEKGNRKATTRWLGNAVTTDSVRPDGN